MTDAGNQPGASEAPGAKSSRALLTRRALLKAARAVFARNGFDHARIEDIAAKAGRTRGAFYANFTDKEDVFFAIFEEDVDRDQSELLPLLRARTSAAQRLLILGTYLSSLCKDRERTLLNLEFKLYAVRHPRRRKRLADLHAAMRIRPAVVEFAKLLPELERQSPAERRAGSCAMSGLLDGLGLTQLFDPDALDQGQLTQLLTLCVKESLLRPG